MLVATAEGAAPARLHKRLIEHLNAEIGLGSIKSMSDAVAWLRVPSREHHRCRHHRFVQFSPSPKGSTDAWGPLQSTFMYVRMCANPTNYGVRVNKAIGPNSSRQDLQDCARQVDAHLHGAVGFGLSELW